MGCQGRTRGPLALCREVGVDGQLTGRLLGGGRGWIDQRGDVDLLVTANHAGTEHVQREQVAEVEASVDQGTVAAGEPSAYGPYKSIG